MWLIAHSLLDGRLFVFLIWERIFRTVQILAGVNFLYPPLHPETLTGEGAPFMLTLSEMPSPCDQHISGCDRQDKWVEVFLPSP